MKNINKINNKITDGLLNFKNDNKKPKKLTSKPNLFEVWENDLFLCGIFSVA
jgi:hypothetical protein